MSVTPSNMPELGMPAPDFALPDIDGEIVNRDHYSESPALLVVFWCNHCPYVQHIREGFVEFVEYYQTQSLAVVAIMPNDVDAQPTDSPENMKRAADEYGFTFPYLYDETQEVALAYQAACTPDFFLYDQNRHLAYRGRFDGSRPNQGVPVTGSDLRAATNAVLAGESLLPEQAPSIGCNIKWKPGNQPQ
jgi:peroxiredoxin